MTELIERPYAYVSSELGTGHVSTWYPGPYSLRIYPEHTPFVIWADGRREDLDPNPNLSGAVAQLRARLGVQA